MLKDVLDILGKDSGLMMADDEIASSEFTGWLDTGSYALNAQFSGSIFGGIPNNKVTGLAGESATGKTYFTLGLVASFLKNNPTGACVYFDSEAAVTKKMMQAHGLDPKRVAISEPESIQDFKTRALRFLQAYEKLDPSKRPPTIFVLDSLGMLPTDKEVDDAAEGSDKRDMTRSPQIRSVFRTLTLKLARLKIPMIVTNHTYEVVGAYVPTKEMSGGGGLKYAASTIAFLGKRKEKDDDKEVIGNIIKVTAAKSRFTKEYSTVEVLLNFETGLDRYYGLHEIAEEAGIFKKVSTRIELPNGDKVFMKQILRDPEKFYTPEVLQMIEEACKKKFMYGKQEDDRETSTIEPDAE
jgi:RecA/RadA recombinase